MTHRTRLITAFIAGLGLVLTACGDSVSPPTTAPLTATQSPTTTTGTTPETAVPLEVAAAPPEDYAGFRAQPTACGAQAPPEAAVQTYAAPEDQGLDPSKLVIVRIETSCGDLVVELDPSMAPETVNSFVFLARQGYFDGTASHRLLPGYVLQAGDPTATGRGNPGYTIPDELPEAGAYTQGVLAMANAGPGTTGSQFFIMLADAGLPPNYSVFGRVVDGLDVLDAIAAVPLGNRRSGFSVETSVPLETVYLERVVVEE